MKSTLRMFGALPVLGMLAVSLAGCSAMRGYAEDPEDDVILTDLKTNYFGAGFDKLVADHYTGTCGETRRPTRDDIVYHQMKVYELELSHLKRGLNGDGNWLAAGTDITALALNAAGAVTGEAETKAALAAASGGVLGANGVINKDVFYQRTIPAIIVQIEANFAKAEGTVYTGLKQDDCTYPLSRAELDVGALRDAGSLPNAVSVLTQQSTDTKNAQDTANAMTRSAPYATDQSAVTLRNWVQPGGVLNGDRFKQFATWLTTYNGGSLKDYPTDMVIDTDTPDFQKARIAALADSKLAIPASPATPGK